MEKLRSKFPSQEKKSRREAYNEELQMFMVVSKVQMGTILDLVQINVAGKKENYTLLYIL